MTLTSEFDPDKVKTNQNAKYLGQRSVSSKVIVRTDAHVGSIAVPGPLKQSVTMGRQSVAARLYGTAYN